MSRCRTELAVSKEYGIGLRVSSNCASTSETSRAVQTRQCLDKYEERSHSHSSFRPDLSDLTCQKFNRTYG